MKRQLLLLLGLLVMMMSAVGYASTATVTLTAPSVVVYDVPFYTSVGMSADAPFIEYDLNFGSDTTKAIFLDHTGWAFTYNGKLSGVKDAGASYRMFTEADGKQLNALTVNVRSKFTPASVADTKLVLKDGSKFTPAPGYSAFTLDAKPSAVIKPVISSCGDGVVGYVDTDKNGVFDAGKEKQEACDTKLPGGDGCSADCTFVKKEYRVKGFETLAKKSSCDFGSYSCVLEKLKSRELFLAKTDALIKGDCFPYNEHVDAAYCEKGVGVTKPGEDGRLTLKQKINLVAQVGVALRDLLEDKEVVGTK